MLNFKKIIVFALVGVTASSLYSCSNYEQKTMQEQLNDMSREFNEEKQANELLKTAVAAKGNQNSYLINAKVAGIESLCGGIFLTSIGAMMTVAARKEMRRQANDKYSELELKEYQGLKISILFLVLVLSLDFMRRLAGSM